MQIPWLGEIEVGELGKRSFRSFLEHRMPTHAAALAYQGLFALFPFIIFLGVLLVVLQMDSLFERLTEQARSLPTPQVPGLLEPLVEQARPSLPKDLLAPVEGLVEQGKEVATTRLLPFGIVFFALWSASGVALTLMDSLNIVNQVEETRPLWKRLALSVLCTPAFAVIAIVGVGLLLIWPQLAQWTAGWIGLSEALVALWAWFRIPVALFLLLLIVLFVYRFAPNRDCSVRFVVPGAILAVIVWAAVSVGFSVYLANFANYGVIYGSLGAAIALLTYLYLSAAALLWGEEVNVAIYRGASDNVTQN
ncbi:MAG: YihY/virulence factor BrkB family protein, partial [Rubrobacter sp.]|nr:YihY/virulence factor BrkB family protein [Rubrobacter sp.]